MASRARPGHNEPEPQPIIVKKVIAPHRQHHHGGQWKIAYADFVTAMMSFFLLLWLVSTTDEAKRRGLADYFSPTMVEIEQDSAGSDGLLGGDTLSEDDYPHRSARSGAAAIAIPGALTEGSRSADKEQQSKDRERFRRLRKTLDERMERSPELKKLKTHVRLTETPEGLRIDLVDEADFSMFRIGTDQLVPEALRLVREVAGAIAAMPNPVIIRGHTDARAYGPRQPMNNWLLSTARAEATRMALHGAGLGEPRFARIEGVADTQPYSLGNRYDPRNRRMSITLAWSESRNGQY